MAKSPSTQKPVEVVQAFVERINRGDVNGIIAMLTADHVFVDALGESVHGAKAMRPAWTGYLKCFPDYEINVELVIDANERIGVFGTASGTYAGSERPTDAMDLVVPDQDRSWHIPAAWLAVVRGDRIAEWHVYCDTQAMVASMADFDEAGDDEFEVEL